jgi:hypothetical protein
MRAATTARKKRIVRTVTTLKAGPAGSLISATTLTSLQQNGAHPRDNTL